LSAARGVAVGALVVVLAVVAWLVLRGETGTEYKLRFATASQLVKGNEVQVGGNRIGTVEDIELSDDNQADVTIRVKDDIAPLHEGTTATIRLTSLSGVANRYISLTPGPNSNSELEDGALISTDRTTPVVDLDQLFNALDEKTRRGLQQFITGNAEWYEGKGREANRAAKYFNPALSATRRLVGQLIADQGTLTSFLRNTSKAMAALAARRQEITDLVTNANGTMQAIGSESSSLDRALRVLPDTLRKGSTTFVNLRATLDDLDVLVEASKPATKDLAPLFRELRPLVADARPTIRDLSRMVNTGGPSNDLTDLLRTTPALARASRSALGDARRSLRASLPNLKFGRPYGPELIGWLKDFGFSAAAYDANGHYARVQPLFFSHAFTDTPSGGVLRPIPSSQKYDGLQTRVERRCPGAATQPAVDGSSPWRDTDGSLDCDPSLVPPGP
jgi:phospholipid/cholesterol/gamma-HCH transport system substrate-binding protein